MIATDEDLLMMSAIIPDLIDLFHVKYDIPDTVRVNLKDGIDLNDQLRKYERPILEAYLNATHGNVRETARLLKLQRTTLIARLESHDMKGFGRESKA